MEFEKLHGPLKHYKQLSAALQVSLDQSQKELKTLNEIIEKNT